MLVDELRAYRYEALICALDVGGRLRMSSDGSPGRVRGMLLAVCLLRRLDCVRHDAFTPLFPRRKCLSRDRRGSHTVVQAKKSCDANSQKNIFAKGDGKHFRERICANLRKRQ